MTPTRHISIWLFLLFIFLTASGIAQPTRSFTKVLDCAKAEKADCEKLLESAIAKSEKENEFEAHFKFLTKSANQLIREGHFDLALYTVYNAKRISKNHPVKQGELCFILNATYLYSGNLDSALYYSNRAFTIFSKLGDSTRVGRALVNIGQIEKEMGDYTGAMEKYMAAMKVFRAIGSKAMIARAQVEVATLSAVTGDVEKAIQFNTEAARYYESTEDEHTYAYIILNLANDLIFTKREDTALILLKKAIPIFKQDNDIYLQMNAEAQLGRALHRLGKSEDAIKHFKESNRLGAEQNFMAQLAYNHEFLSIIYRDINKPELALYHSMESYQIHRELGLNEEYRSAVNSLATAYENVNMPDSALKYFREAITIGDTLFSLETKRQLNELKARYESDLKEEQIKAGKAEIELLNQKNEAERNRTIALGLGLILFTLLAIWIITRQRTRMQHNRKISAEKAKTLQAELSIKTEEQKRLKSELDHKIRELTTQALLIAEKNEMMLSFKERLKEISERAEENTAMNQLVNKMDRAENKTQDWDKFMEIFKEVHPDFLNHLNEKFSGLTSNDLRLLALMRMNFSNKEIASILHISDDALKKARYRLRKKLDLPSEENMHDYIMGL